MTVVNFDDVDNYQTGGSYDYLTLKNDGDVAKVRFYIENMDDLKFYVVHEIEVNGKRRYVDCIRAYDQPIDDCPFCREALTNKDYRTIVKMFIPVYDMEDKKVKLFERGRSFKDEIVGHIRRNAPLVNYPCEIERNGKAGDKETTYKVYPLAQEKDDTMIKDLPEYDDVLGGYVFSLTAEQMEDYLETGKLPNSKNDKKEENLPRRTSRTAQAQTADEEEPKQEERRTRRTASRF